MNIVIIGDGKVGTTLSRQLQYEGHSIVVIDNDQNALKNSINSQDIMCVAGNGATIDVQLEAGVNKADLVIACTSQDELNMLCCLIAKKLGANKTIARVRTPEYFAQLGAIKDELGLSMAINPELAAATEMSRVFLFPAATKVELFAKGRVELVEFKLADNSILDYVSLSDLYKKYKIKILVCAVERGSDVFIPNGDFVLRSGDRLSITGLHSEIEKFFKSIGQVVNKVKDVLIVGGGRIGYYLAKQLQTLDMNVKIIEQDIETCKRLSEALPKVTIIHGNGNDHGVLKEEGIESADGFAALTGIDEENIIMSMIAASNNVTKVVTKVNLSTYAEMAEKLGLESIIAPKNVVANNIISYVRAMQNSYESNVETLYKLIDNRVEAVEFVVKQNGKCTGIPLKNLKTKKNMLIACIVRNRKVIFPDGNECILAGDSVILVTTNQRFNDIEDILE